MAALTVKAVRQRIDAAMLAQGSFNTSRFAGAIFGRDTRQLMHGAYAVGAIETSVSTRQRQLSSAGVMVDTSIDVHIAGRYRPDAQVADMDALLDLEATAIQTVEGISRVDLHILYERSRRELTAAAEFTISTIRFRAIHRIALA